MTSAVLYGSRHYTQRQLFSACELNDYAHAAQRRNLKGFTVTCRDDSLNTGSESRSMAVESFADYLDVIDRTRRCWSDRVDVCLGVRVTLVPDNHAVRKTSLRSAVFDCVFGDIAPPPRVASTHSWPCFDRSAQHQAFRRAGDAAETGFFDCIAFDEILESTCRWHWNLESIASELMAAMDRIAKTGVAIEIPTASHVSSRLSAFDAWLLTEMAARQIPVVLNANPQAPWQIARGFEATLDLLSACGFSHVSHFIHRERVDVPVETARGSLQSLDCREAVTNQSMLTSSQTG